MLILGEDGISFLLRIRVDNQYMNSLIMICIKNSRDLWGKLGNLSPSFTIKLSTFLDCSTKSLCTMWHGKKELCFNPICINIHASSPT